MTAARDGFQLMEDFPAHHARDRLSGLQKPTGVSPSPSLMNAARDTFVPAPLPARPHLESALYPPGVPPPPLHVDTRDGTGASEKLAYPPPDRSFQAAGEEREEEEEEVGEWEASEEEEESPAPTPSRMRGHTGMHLAGFDTPQGIHHSEAGEASIFWRVEALVAAPYFEPGFVFLIFLNAMVLAVEMQYHGIETGFQMGAPGQEMTAEESWPGAKYVFEAFEWIFGVAFCIELLLKMIAVRLALVMDPWAWLDVFCVCSWISGQAAANVLPEPALFRLFRTVRVARMMRLVRKLHGFESLYLMTASVKASVMALTWSAVLIFLIQSSMALVLNELLMSYLSDEAIDLEVRFRVYRYYGTFSKATLTMFEMMLANWPDASRVLTEDVSELLTSFVLGYQCLVGFAVVKVIMGVFLQVTFNVASSDDIIMISQKDRAAKNHRKKIGRLFAAADQDNNDKVDINEFREMVVDPMVRQWLASMDCDMGSFGNPDTLFKLMDGGTGQLTSEQLIRGVSRMQGPAKSIDLAVFADQNREIREIVGQVAKDLEELRDFMALPPLEPLLSEKDSAKEPSNPSSPCGAKFSSRRSLDSATTAAAASKRVSLEESVRSRRSAGSSEREQKPGAMLKHGSTEGFLEEEKPSEKPPVRSSARRSWVSFFSFSSSNERRSNGSSRGRSSVLTRRTNFSQQIIGGGGQLRPSVITSEPSFQEKTCWRNLRRVKNLARNAHFEAFFGFLIFVNTMVMALEAQYHGMDMGHSLGYPGELRPAKDVWPWAELFFRVCDWFFLVMFTIEVLFKIIGFQGQFCKDPWNFFDVVIVAAGIAEATASGILPVSSGVLRFARMMRLLRMLRLVRQMKEFDSLHLMITSIKGSIQALIWSSALMFIVQMLLALILNTMLEGYYLDESQVLQDRHRIFMYFGKFSKAMLTMFEITFANWIPCARSLTENVNEFYVIFALTHKFLIGFAVVNVITGVFLNETFRVSATDDSIMITQKQRQIAAHTKKMMRLFNEVDEDGNGILDREEFKYMLEDPWVVTWLSSMGLEVHDADTVFTMVAKDAESQSEITALELVKGVARLKGNAKSLDMAVVLQENRKLLQTVEGLKRQWKHLQREGPRRSLIS